MSNHGPSRKPLIFLFAVLTLALVGVAVAGLPIINGVAVSLERSTAESTAGSAQDSPGGVHLELTHGEESSARLGNANGVTAFIGRLDPAVPAIQRNRAEVNWQLYPAE